MSIDVDALLSLQEEDVEMAYEDIESAIRICTDILGSADSTAQNRLKSIEVKFQLLAAKGRMAKKRGEQASAEIERLERTVALLASELQKYNQEFVTRCLNRHKSSGGE